jgi:hypothetical protein
VNLKRLGAKLFLEQPAIPDIRELIPVFHQWIQQQRISGHLLLDVHDYSHVPMGPGILLVGHQGDFNIDLVEGRVGLQYQRKRPELESETKQLTAVMMTLMEASCLLESTTFSGGLPKFDPRTLRISVLDRLSAPNTAATFHRFETLLGQFWKDTVKSDRFTIVQMGDPREPFAVELQTESAPSSRALLSSLKSLVN